MKVLAINGSHRKGRNTARLLQTVLEEARSLGAETDFIELSDYRIKPCLACDHCLKAVECSIKDDDMEWLVNQMKAADAIVLGSPVYVYNVTGLMKDFMDRMRWLHMKCNVLRGKVGAAVTHAGLRNGGQEIVQAILERFLISMGMVLVDSRDQENRLYNSGAMGTLFGALEGDRVIWRRSVEDDLLALRECRVLGRNVVKWAKLLAAAKSGSVI
ncbi:flavodoxin family protein [Moorellaceae bacterium AZ2]